MADRASSRGPEQGYVPVVMCPRTRDLSHSCAGRGAAAPAAPGRISRGEMRSAHGRVCLFCLPPRACRVAASEVGAVVVGGE